MSDSEESRVRQLAWEMQLAAAQEAREFAAFKPFKEEDNVVPLRGNLAPPPHPDTPLRTYCAADLEGQTVPARQWLVEGVIPHRNVCFRVTVA